MALAAQRAGRDHICSCVEMIDTHVNCILDYPGKRHGVDIESLSGGEKTIAALAFVFALAHVKAPPLVVMDEVDAFLDIANVQLVTAYLKQEKVRS